MDMKDGLKKFFSSAAGQVMARLRWWLSAMGGGLLVASYFGEYIYWPRVMMSFLIAFLVPVLLFAPIRNLVARKSNGINAVLLIGLTVFDIVMGHFAVFWQVVGWKSSLIVLVFTVVGLFYNIWMMTFALKIGEK